MNHFTLSLLVGLLIATAAPAQTPVRYRSLPSNGDQGGVIPARRPSGTDPRPSESGMSCEGDFCSSTALDAGLSRATNPRSGGSAEPDSATKE